MLCKDYHIKWNRLGKMSWNELAKRDWQKVSFLGKHDILQDWLLYLISWHKFEVMLVKSLQGLEQMWRGMHWTRRTRMAEGVDDHVRVLLLLLIERSGNAGGRKWKWNSRLRSFRRSTRRSAARFRRCRRCLTARDLWKWEWKANFIRTLCYTTLIPLYENTNSVITMIVVTYWGLWHINISTFLSQITIHYKNFIVNNESRL